MLSSTIIGNHPCCFYTFTSRLNFGKPYRRNEFTSKLLGPVQYLATSTVFALSAEVEGR